MRLFHNKQKHCHDINCSNLIIACFCGMEEVMINVGDVGEDYEHGQQLLKKLSEFRGSSSGVRLMLLF